MPRRGGWVGGTCGRAVLVVYDTEGGGDMTTRAQTGMEPSADAVQAMRERLRALGFLLTDDATRDLLRPVLGIESARLDRHAREAAAACLHSIQDAAREALAILTQG